MPTVTPKSPIKDVYARLRAAGLGTSYVKSTLLPDWWDDSLAGTKSGFLHGLSFIAHRAGIQVGTLMRQDQAIEPKDFGQVRFKKPKDADSSKIKWAKNIAAAAAQLIADIVSKPFENPGASAADLRKQIARATGSKTVTLPALLDLTWDHGIPVVFVGHLPPGSRRMDGMAAQLDGRPVIVTSKKSVHTAWLAFVIAHELGHICLGHVNNKIVVDESINGSDTSPEEAQANSFAVELLTGTPRANYDLGTFVPSTVVRLAKEISFAKNVDPGVVILNHAFHRAGSANWGMVKRALKQLEPDANAPKQICERMLKELDLKGLDEDQREYVERLASASSSTVPQ
jgi:hypothetical protein